MRISLVLIGVVLAMTLASNGFADDVYRVRIFFGLSLPGGGGVSLNDWQAFEQREIANVFDGFNVVDSTGYYKGKAERSKIVTVIVDSAGLAKAKSLARRYAKRFEQESVMIVKVPVLEWDFVEAEAIKKSD